MLKSGARSILWLDKFVLLLVMCLPLQAQAKEYLMTTAHPNKLFLINAEDGSVARAYDVPGQHIGSWSIVVSPDSRVVYMNNKQNQGIVGLDLESGEAVFQATLSKADEKVRSVYGLDVSPDGKELYAYVSPVKLLPDEYRVMDNRILVFDTRTGLQAEPIRVLPAPRRVFNMMTANDGKSLYLAGWDVNQIDVKTGETLRTFPIHNWKTANRSPGNAYAHWVSWEQSDINTLSVFSVHTDRDPYSIEAYQNSALQINRETGEIKVWDYEYAENLIFSMVASPVKPEVFAIYNSLAKIDSKNYRTLKRITMETTYYSINISADGETVFVGGGGCKIAAHRASDLERLWRIELPGCADQSFSNLRMVHR